MRIDVAPTAREACLSRWKSCLAGISLAVLVACGSPEPQGSARSEPAEPTASATPACDPHAYPIVTSDPAIVGSLDELVERSPLIVTGRVSGKGGMLNTIRLEEDPTKPDPHQFGAGQVYTLEVEEYIKGSGAETLGVVNPEGYLSSRDGAPVDLPESEAEIDCLRAAYLDYMPLQVGERYLFFLNISPYYDPEVDYAGTSWGHPWRFLLPVDGRARPESPHVEANERFPEMPSAELVELVRSLIASST